MSSTSEIRCYKNHKDRGVVCGHLLVNHGNIKCSSCGEEHSLINLLVSAIESRQLTLAEVVNRLSGPFIPGYRPDPNKIIESANGLVNRILRTIKYSGKSIPFREQNKCFLREKGLDLFHIPAGFSFGSISDLACNFNLHFPVFKENDNISIGNQPLTHGQFVFFEDKKSEVVPNSRIAFSGSVESDRHFTLDGEDRILLWSAPYLNNLLFLMLSRAIKNEISLDDTKELLDGVVVRVSDHNRSWVYGCIRFNDSNEWWVECREIDSKVFRIHYFIS